MNRPRHTVNYIERQLTGFAPLPLPRCGQIRIKLNSERGSTNWLNITPETAARIEEALHDDAVEKDDREEARL